MSLIERAGKAVAVELGYCDPDEWGTDECNREDRDTALRAAAAALDAANCEGAVEALERIAGAFERTMPGPRDAQREKVLEIIAAYRATTGGQ